MAEELVRYRFVNRMRTLLNDVETYPLQEENSRLWRNCYSAWVALLETKTVEAETLYETIIQSKQTEPRLKAYALCDLGWILSRFVRLVEPDAIEKAISILEQSLGLVPLDFHLVGSLSSLAHVRSFQGEWRKAATYLESAERFFEEEGDVYGQLYVYGEMKVIPGFQGDFREMLRIHALIRDTLSKFPYSPNLRARYDTWGSEGLQIGRYAEVERRARERLAAMQQLGDMEPTFFALCELGEALGKQNRFDDGKSYLVEAANLVQRIGDQHSKKQSGISIELLGKLLVHQGGIEEARNCLIRSLTIRQEIDHFGLPDVLNGLGRLYAVCGEWNTASGYYRDSLKSNIHGRHYQESEAITGICLVAIHQGSLTDEKSLAARAEQLAQQYEYNDHLASLRLTQGHVAWDGHLPEWGSGFDVALRYYQHALTYALRYNRFLLDEALSGRPQGTPLRPIIPHCLERGEEGRRMLIALRDWWKTGINDIGTPRPDTISPIPEGIPLLEAERIAREREPGDDSPQRTVLEQIDEALPR
jgi:tetratricopeptide (TPR) repeat protein